MIKVKCKKSILEREVGEIWNLETAFLSDKGTSVILLKNKDEVKELRYDEVEDFFEQWEMYMPESKPDEYLYFMKDTFVVYNEDKQSILFLTQDTYNELIEKGVNLTIKFTEEKFKEIFDGLEDIAKNFTRSRIMKEDEI